MSLSVARELGDGPAYAGQQVCKLKLEGTPSLLSTTITTGVIASAISINFGQVTGFLTRFNSTFDECRILGCDVRITPVSASSGVSKMWFDEKSSSTPTANEAQERTAMPLANTNTMSKSRTLMRWRARDLLDLQYNAVSATATPVTFKVYTDLATWGAPAAVTALWLIEPVFY